MPDAIKNRVRLTRRCELDPLLAVGIGDVAQFAVVHPPAAVDEVEGS